MSNKAKGILSPILAGIIAGGGALIGVLTELAEGSGLGDIGSVTWSVIVVTVVIAGAKDLKTYFAAPPTTLP